MGDQPQTREHFAILDGWRALSIMCVLAGHWLPLGPAQWQMNASVAASGMALFFCLSGFLITHFLLQGQPIRVFLVKRFVRIVPLAWLATLIAVVGWGSGGDQIVANLLFFANLPPARLLEAGHHLWSLDVEVQFYAVVALCVALFGRRCLNLLPLLCLGVTALRIADGEIISIVTWHRADEILAGGCVALWWHRFGKDLSARQSGLVAWLPMLALIALLWAANPHSGNMGYLRPYFAAAAVGGSLALFPRVVGGAFAAPQMRYVASISYALYVIHGVLTATWLGGSQAATVERYLLRIPLAALTLLLAHLSTRYYESYFMKLGRSFLARVPTRT